MERGPNDWSGHDVWGGQALNQLVENNETDSGIIENQLYHGFQQQYQVEVESMRHNFQVEHTNILNDQSRAYEK